MSWCRRKYDPVVVGADIYQVINLVVDHSTIVIEVSDLARETGNY